MAASSQSAGTSWALIDQALVSGTNFSAGILLARLLGPSGFGLYTIIWTVCICANLLQWGLIISPLQSIGSKRVLSGRHFYFTAVLSQQVFFTLLSGSVFFLGILVFAAFNPRHEPDSTMHGVLRSIAVPVTLAMCLSQTQDFLRRYFLIRGTPRVAYLSDCARYGSFLAALGGFYYLKDRAIEHIFWAQSGASCLGTLVTIPFLRIHPFRTRMFKAVIRRHFVFARWLVPATALQWINANIHFYVAAIILGPASVGTLKASQNVMAFTAVVVEGLENSVPSHASRKLAQEGQVGLLRYLWTTAKVSIGLLAIVVGIIATAPNYFMHLLFGDRFTGQGGIVIGFGVVSLIHISGYFVNVFIRTFEKTILIFRSDIIVLVWASLSSPMLIKHFGLYGAVVGLGTCHLIRLLSLSIAVRRNHVFM